MTNLRMRRSGYCCVNFVTHFMVTVVSRNVVSSLVSRKVILTGLEDASKTKLSGAKEKRDESKSLDILVQLFSN